MIRKIIVIIVISVIFGVLLPSFSFSQVKPPETLEEAKGMGEKVSKEVQIKLPGILEKIWNEEILPVLEKYYQWIKINIWSPMERWFKKVAKPKVRGEREKRKPLIEEKLKKEKEELKGELPKIKNYFQVFISEFFRNKEWERFKELIK